MEFPLLQLWRSEVLKSRFPQACTPSGGFRTESASLLSQLLEATWISWLVASSSILKASSLPFSYHSPCLSHTSTTIITSPSLALTLLPPSYKEPWNDTGPTHITEDNRSIPSNILYLICEVPLAMEVTATGSADWGGDIFGAVTLYCLILWEGSRSAQHSKQSSQDLPRHEHRAAGTISGKEEPDAHSSRALRRP